MNIKLLVKRNAPTILTCVGGLGVVATSIMAAKATPKAIRLLEEAKEKKGENLTKLETFKVAGPVYIPSIITGISTLACIFGANALNKRQQATLMSAYALLDSSYKEYKSKVKEVYGENADKEIREEIVKDKYEDEAVTVDDGKQLFYEEYSGRYFETTPETVLKAEYEINKILSTDCYATLNEFYDLLNIPTVDFGDELGWSSAQMFDMYWSSWLDFEHEKVVMEDGLECFIIHMPYPPVADYSDY